jgi:integrase
LLWASSRLCAFGIRRGLNPQPEVLLRTSVIERFVLEGCSGYSLGSKRTARSNLLWLNRRLFDTDPPLGVLARGRSSAPYSTSEVSAYLALVDAQPTQARRMRASGLISLGAGAGLLGTDLRMLRGTDIIREHRAVVVRVTGTRARLVPVRAEFSDRVIEAAAWAADRFITGGVRPERRNLTARLTDSMAGGADLDPLSFSRLRSTWLVACAADIGLATFMAAAGVRCSQRLGDLASYLEPGDLKRSIEVLGARC